jgi:hypothetical protein
MPVATGATPSRSPTTASRHSEPASSPGVACATSTVCSNVAPVEVTSTI